MKTNLCTWAVFARGVAVLMLCLLANTVFGEQAAEKTEQGATPGEMKLEGKYIKQLTLEHRGGNNVKFDQPGESIKVVVGRYRLREVQLESGYTCWEWILPELKQNWIEVGEDEPAVLKAGAPLKQIVKAKREGRVLSLDYQLSGIGGESYARDDRSKPPTFTVYKGDKKIASGTFEYG